MHSRIASAEERFERHRHSPRRWIFLVIATYAICGCEYLENQVAGPDPSIAGGGWLTTYNSREGRLDLVLALDPRRFAQENFRGASEKIASKQVQPPPRATDVGDKIENENNQVPSNSAGKKPQPTVIGMGDGNENQEDVNEQAQVPTWKSLSDGQKIDLAFAAFYDSRYGPPSDIDGTFDPRSMRFRRDRIQEQLLAVSKARCALFKTLLYRIRSKSNAILGSLATTAGVVGGIVTGATASRALAGTSGILGGTQAVVNQELFQNLATQVIIEGIDVRRREIYDQIVRRGQALSIQEYPVEAAVKDAIYYHSQCNVVTGFEMAKDSINTYADPGIDAANRMLVKLKSTRGLLQNRNLTPKEASKLLTESNSVLGLAGKPLVDDREQDLPTKVLTDAFFAVGEATRSYMETAAEYAGKTAEKFKKLSERADSFQQSARKTLGTCETVAKEKSTKVFMAQVKLGEQGKLDDKTSNEWFELAEARQVAGALSRSIRSFVDLVRARFDKAGKALADTNSENTSLDTAIQSANQILMVDAPPLATCPTTS